MDMLMIALVIFGLLAIGFMCVGYGRDALFIGIVVLCAASGVIGYRIAEVRITYDVRLYYQCGEANGYNRGYLAGQAMGSDNLSMIEGGKRQ